MAFNGIEDLAFLAGIIMGSIILLAVSWVWISKQVLGASGVTLSVVGVTLVGLTVWSSVRIEASPDRLLAEFQRELDEVNESIDEVDNQLQDVSADVEQVGNSLNEVVAANILFSENIESLATSVESSRRQILTLTDALDTARTVPAAQLNEIRQQINQTETVPTNPLRINREALQNLRGIQ